MIARTLANIHPLMSPTGTDSDSEHSREHSIAVGVGVGHRCQKGSHYNFPDVVPASEHLQVQQVNKGLGPPTAQHNTLSVLRTNSVDLLSSESEAEVSQYHAAVEANLQSVVLISKTNCVLGSNRAARPTRTCKNGCEDISSLDSISNHSFDDDEDLEHKLASLSPTSSLADGLDDNDDDDDDDDDEEEEEDDDDDNDDDIGVGVDINHGINQFDDEQDVDLFVGKLLNRDPNAHDEFKKEIIGETTVKSTENEKAIAATPPPMVLPQYSATEERRNSRNWQKITLPDGRMFEIDMRVIEPYKRVLSHGGYLKAGGHNAIVIFCACHLPDRSRADYSYVMDNLFLYVVKTLEQLVTDDYVLIYLHGGCNRRNVPPFPWLKKCYQLLDRRLRKSLKNMYLVHPTFWVKSIVWMTRPFVSVKFWRKLVYVRSLEELGKYVSVEKAAIPEKVKQFDAKHT